VCGAKPFDDSLVQFRLNPHEVDDRCPGIDGDRDAGIAQLGDPDHGSLFSEDAGIPCQDLAHERERRIAREGQLPPCFGQQVGGKWILASAKG